MTGASLTDVPGCRDVVDHGVNGFLCEARDAGDLTEKIRQFISLPDIERAAMGECGRQKMEREYDEQIVIGRYMQEIDVILVNVHRFDNP